MTSKRKGIHPLAYPRRKSDSWRERQRRRSSGVYAIVEPKRVIDIPELPDTLILSDGPSAWELDPYDAPTRPMTVEELWRALELDAEIEESDKKNGTYKR